MIKRFPTGGAKRVYSSVIEPGEVKAGSKIEIVSRDPNRVTVADLAQLIDSPESLGRALLRRFRQDRDISSDTRPNPTTGNSGPSWRSS